LYDENDTFLKKTGNFKVLADLKDGTLFKSLLIIFFVNQLPIKIESMTPYLKATFICHLLKSIEDSLDNYNLY
jgi:hypothetical protein